MWLLALAVGWLVVAGVVWALLYAAAERERSVERVREPEP